jgi:hypothetical protein
VRFRNPLNPELPQEGNPARGDAAQLIVEVVPLVNQASGASWYEQHGNEADAAVINLCKLRRAGAGDRGTAEAGDEAVRAALEQADPAAVIWLTSRVISYMDEQGYPELYARMFG